MPLLRLSKFGSFLTAVVSMAVVLSVPASGAIAQFMMNNEKLRFGGGGSGSSSYSYVDSIAGSGLPEQPHYKSSNGNWYKLTYSTIPLSMTLGSGTGGANWSGATVGSAGNFDSGHMGLSSLSNLAVDVSATTTRSPSQAVDYGYGTVVVSGDVALNGATLGLSHSYQLGQNDSYVQIRSTVTNNSGSAVDNLMIWVGTRDDWVGNSDGPTKTRGNLVNGSFQALSAKTQDSSAIQITTGSEGVLFYSTTAGTKTAINSCCSFSNAYNQNPATSEITLTGDGSYAISLPVGTLANGESTTITWFYAAGAIADLAEVAAAVASAAAPTAPTVEPGAGQAEVSWEQPSSDDPIVGYRLRYSTDGGSNWTVHGTDFRGDSAPRTLTVTGLTNGTTYLFQVAALTGDIDNSPTVGSWSASAEAVIPGAPTAPTIDGITAGNTKLTVAFTAPTYTSGVAITDYEYSTDNGSSWTSSGSTSSPIVISGLTNGTTYQVKLRAKGSLSGVPSSATAGTPAATVPDAPTISSIATSAGTLTVSFTAPSDNGGAAISNYKWSTDGTNYRALSPAQTTSPIVLTTLSTDGTTLLVDGTAYPITLKAVNSNGDSVASNSITATPGVTRSSSRTNEREEEPVVPTVVSTPQPPRAFTPPQVTLPTPQTGPVLRNGSVPTPPRAPSVLLGGRPTTVVTTVPTTTQLDVRAGAVNLGVKVQEDQGQISEAPDGTTEIAVRKGAAATITGSGFRPGATVQVFMPLQGDNAKELTRIPVEPDGSFDGSAPFATRPGDAPLPIGKNVLQLVSVDNDGNQVVVEMAVNIAQGAPAPEQNRIDGVIPNMTPGQSVATSGGEPVPVRITPVAEQKLAVVEGDGWSMAVNVAAEDGGVEPSEGGALLKLVRNESALVSGSGFMPGTRADVWLFSDPTLLGTVTIDENGEFTGEVNIDPNMIPVGEHTLQLQGVGEDGYIKAANMGVLVDDPVEAAPTAVEQGLGLIWWIIAAIVLLALIVVLIASRRRQDA